MRGDIIVRIYLCWNSLDNKLNYTKIYLINHTKNYLVNHEQSHKTFEIIVVLVALMITYCVYKWGKYLSINEQGKQIMHP